MTVWQTPDQIRAELDKWDDLARQHKRQANQHRRAAREARQRHAEIEAKCRRLGIEVTREGAGEFHGRHRPRPGSDDAH